MEIISNKKRILYCIHISWGWIKQRPHFLAEGLGRYFDVNVLCKKEWASKGGENKTYLKLIFPFRLPFERFKYVKKINTYLRHHFLRSIINTYDFLWFTAPSDDSSFLLSIAGDKKIIYDCMDDILEFPNNSLRYDYLFHLEKELYDRADLIICSSNYLKGKLQNRYGQKRIVIVNNALSLTKDNNEITSFPSNMSFFLKSAKTKIVYIGTVSEWLDVDLCKKIEQSNANVDIFLFGPNELNAEDFNSLKNIHICGPVDHKYVSSIMNYSDILIMPFVVNELILSVNPVKLYEYIKSGKPCIAPKYGESEPFKDYVYLYEDHSDCIKIVESLLSGEYVTKKSKSECMKFAEENTWECRVDVIKNELNSLTVPHSL